MAGIDRSVHLIFEYGIELTRAFGPLWRAPRASSRWRSWWLEADDFRAIEPARLVCATTVDKRGRRHTVLMSPDGGRPLSFGFFDIHPVHSYRGEYFYKLMHLEYALQNACYHCIRLAEAYTRVCDWEATMSRRPWEPLVPERYSMAAVDEVYFEFDALATALRRGLDSARYPMWHGFGSGLGTIPGNFKKTLDVLADKGCVPDDLANLLAGIWRGVGARVKAYRDCALHYVPLNSIFGQEVWKLEDTPWHAFVFLPDNPDVRSFQDFTFDARKDALVFGWEATSRIMGALGELVAALPGVEECQGDAEAQMPN